MKALALSLALALALALPVSAQEPTPAPGGGAITVAPDPLPYDFEPYDYDEGGSEFAQFDPFAQPEFINSLGSTSLTLFQLVDAWDVLAIFVVLLLAMWILRRVYMFTLTSTPGGQVDMSIPEENPYRPNVDETPQNIGYWEGRPRVPKNLAKYYNNGGELKRKYRKNRVFWED